ncbi:MAG TPA: DUF881 domain-containing protein [Propionibacteriaceae bacterium]|jgi:uncharacterized protein YlxW (UPF0749 family)|nr:DUF881 domain-containing protein [Propionibacteriaceae bacterium]
MTQRGRTSTSVRRGAQHRGHAAEPTTAQQPPPVSQMPDASMDLLNQISRQPVDPDYALAAARGTDSSGGRWTLGLLAIIIGALFAVAALQTTRAAPALQSERSELISRVQTAEREQDQLRGRVTTLTQEIATLRAAALGDDDAARVVESRIDALDPVVGNVAVDGPGVLIVVDDSPSAAADARDRVLDIDLQVLANGLWEADAEAVAINGHRLSGLTAIRSAGDAITVDYRSLTRPYRVEAIGNPRTLQARFVESSAGAWWNDLAQNRRMRYEISDVKQLDLAADPGIVLRRAGRATS